MNNCYQPLKLIKENPGCRVLLAQKPGGNRVVIKEVKIQAHEVWFAQFRMEVQVLQALNGIQVPKLLEVHDEPRGCWLVEEYIEGTDLARWLQTHPAKELRKQIFLEILERIQRVHEAGYLYLDLKPENILVYEDHVWLIDFNACLPIGSIRPILVNRDSLPPEAMDGKRMNEKADQIGLGKLYLMMFGPSSIAWTALARHPDQRFRNLDVFAAQIHKQGRIHPALLASLAAVGLGILGFVFFKPDAASSSKNGLPEAPKICEELKTRLEAGNLDLSDYEWIVDARAALEQSHFALAGFLHEQKPASESFQVEFYDFLLGLLLSSDVSITQLDQLVERLPEQVSWVEQFKDLCKGLLQARIILDSGQIQRLLVLLDAQCPLDEECCQCLMNYLLLYISRRPESMELPANLEADIAEQCPDLYDLYAKARQRTKNSIMERK